VAWSPDSQHLAAASWGDGGELGAASGGEVVVLDRSGQVLARRSTVVGEALSDVEFSPDGQLVAVVDGMLVNYRDTPLDVTLWDWQRGEVVLRIPLTGGGASVAMHPQGRRLVIAGGDRATVVDLSGGAEVATMVGHGSGIFAVAYSPDGSRIATGHEDGTVLVWDAVSARPVTVLRGQTTRIKTLVFSPDSSRLAASDSRATVRVSALDVDELVEIARAEVTRGLTDDECRVYLELDTCSDRPS